MCDIVINSFLDIYIMKIAGGSFKNEVRKIYVHL